jgi:hypothetical protein
MYEVQAVSLNWNSLARLPVFSFPEGPGGSADNSPGALFMSTLIFVDSARVIDEIMSILIFS